MRSRLDEGRSSVRALQAAIKINLIRELEIPEELLVDVELDHRIPLALGGAPSEEQGNAAVGRGGGKGRIETCLRGQSARARAAWMTCGGA